jgi:Dolichyl-phosphate-mannose-protein mannosyltransferase
MRDLPCPSSLHASSPPFSLSKEGARGVDSAHGGVAAVVIQTGQGVASVLALALVLRVLLPVLALVYTGDLKSSLTPDTSSYLKPAQSLLRTGRFAIWSGPEIVRTPGYPVFLLPGLAAGHVIPVTIALQVLASCLTVYLVYRISLLLFERRRLAVSCALLYAFEPLSILYTGFLVSETLFTTMTTLFLYILVKYLRTGSTWALLGAAIALAASIYVRPVGYFLPPILACGLVVWGLATRRFRPGRLFAHVALFLIVSMGLTGLWQLRNWREAGYPGFSTVASLNMYYYLGASVLAARESVPFYDMQTRLGWPVNEEDWTRAEKHRYIGREGRRIVLEHPVLYARIHLDGIMRMLLDPSGTECLKYFQLYPQHGGLQGVMVDKGLVRTVVIMAREHPLLFWSNLVLAPLLGFYLLFSVVALFSRRFITDPAVLAALGVAAYFLLIAGGTDATGRFRHPDMPILCIFAGYGLFFAIGKWRARGSRRSSGMAN